jgi:two-component system, OmpR family, response regulator RegX3
MTKILLIEDSKDIGELVTCALNSYVVQQAFSLAEADLALKKDEYNLLLIDVGLPDGNGFDLCLRLSQDPHYQDIPRILLTALDKTSEIVYGFNCGGDDYLTKPFNIIELRARADRYLRKQETKGTKLITYSPFAFNIEFQRCFLIDDKNKIDLGLTPTEFRLFLTLARNEGHVLTRQMLEKTTWEANGTAIQARGIDTHIAHLRKKLGSMKNAVSSIYGQGYSFTSDFKKSEAA